MKLMIVDDETLVRVGLKTIFQSFNEDLDYFEACDGQQALDIYKQERPALVFVDINMPVLNGLEFILLARKFGYRSKFVILTCIEDLSTVRKAIKLGISDYIVKTAIKSDELKEIILKTRKELFTGGEGKEASGINMEEGTLRSLTLENVIKNMINLRELDDGMGEDLIERYGIDFFKGDFSVLAMYSSRLYKISADSAEDCKGKYAKLQASLVNLVNDMLCDYYGGICFKLEQEEFVIILPFRPGRDGDRRAFVEEFCSRLIKSSKLYLNVDISIGIFINASCKRLGIYYEYAQEALFRRFYSNQSAYFIFGDEVSKHFPAEQIRIFKEKAAKRLDEMEYGLLTGVFAEFMETLFASRGSNVNEIYDAYIQVFYLIVGHIEQNYPDKRDELLKGVDYRALIKCDTIFELERVFNNLLRNLKEMSAQNNECYHDKIIKRVQNFITSNINNEIDLVKAAAHVNISPGYLSELFKQKTGEKFVDFVMRSKMVKAAEYIKQGEKPSAVFEKIGYGNYSYFCRVFKKTTGKSIREFSRSNNGK